MKFDNKKLKGKVMIFQLPILIGQKCFGSTKQKLMIIT